MTYLLLRGFFVIRYPNRPRDGPGLDGNTVKFLPDTPALVEALPRVSGRPPNLDARGIAVRLDAVDALETRFGETHQELVGAEAARDALLRLLGFTAVTYSPICRTKSNPRIRIVFAGTCWPAESMPTAGSSHLYIPVTTPVRTARRCSSTTFSRTPR